MNEEEIKIIKSIVALNKIVDKLEQRISKLERVLESHAKCIGQLNQFVYDNEVGVEYFINRKDIK